MGTENTVAIKKEYENLKSLYDEARQANGDRFSILLKVRNQVASTPWLLEVAQEVFKTQIADDREKRPTGTALFFYHDLETLIEGINHKYEFESI